MPSERLLQQLPKQEEAGNNGRCMYSGPVLAERATIYT
jgi:hypothetical protein